MNFCTRCQSIYAVPGTCNCFARTQPPQPLPAPRPMPYIGDPPVVPWFPNGGVVPLTVGSGVVPLTIGNTGALPLVFDGYTSNASANSVCSVPYVRGWSYTLNVS